MPADTAPANAMPLSVPDEVRTIAGLTISLDDASRLVAEMQAREAAAWAAGAAAMRVECERAVQNVVDTYELERILLEGFRALPLPPMPGTTQGGNADE